MKRLITVTFLFFILARALTSVSMADEPRRAILAADYSKKRLALIDNQGRKQWEYPIRDIHDLHVLPGGNILFQTSWTKLVEINSKREVVWTYDSGMMNGNQGKRVEVHAFQRLGNGVTMIVESGAGRIIEVDKAGKLLKEIPLKRNRPSAHSDTRLARKLNNGHYLVAHERDGAVREYDGNGRVVWEYEVPLFGRPRKGGHGLGAFGNSVYSAYRLPSGNTLIGTGNGHSVLEVTPDKRVVWSIHQHDLPGIKLAWVTMLDVLPNGNIVIGNCHAGPDNPQLVEVTRDKKVVWTFKDFENFGNSLAVHHLMDVHRGVIR